ncbi:hypothetical protein G7085_07710 [Tessaracoccus sp. HDW20]|uniref:hypothetical protein n=1 Tax=Tessaracoccus coleopterorum TaxID=2714950 RepID=UPI0018D4C071|nr:hypothetical protein [Tessaracoccus coleopterorum]NHB84530.1 hypothetical protein [Tessaracoccus coleopterorum]
MEDNTLQELRDTVAALSEQVASLQEKVTKLEAQQEIPEADLIAIGAAVAAFFGHKARIRAIRYGSQNRWGAASRSRVHDRSVPHVR